MLSLVPSSSVDLLRVSSTGNQGLHTRELPFTFAPAPYLPGVSSQGSPSGHSLLSMAALPALTGFCCHLSGHSEGVPWSWSWEGGALTPPRHPHLQGKGAFRLRDFFCWCQTSEPRSPWGPGVTRYSLLAVVSPRAPPHTSLPGDSLGGAQAYLGSVGPTFQGLCLPSEGWSGLRVLISCVPFPAGVTSFPAPLWS